MTTLLQDLRYAARTSLKAPGFTLVVVLTLALGIGANTTIFSMVNAILLKSLPFPAPERLVMVWGDSPEQGNHRNQVSATDVADWRSGNSVFAEITTFTQWRPIFSGANGEPERLPAMQVGDGYFKVMGTEPLLGRAFLPEEQEEGKDRVIILSYGLWQSRFGADPAVIGKTALLNARPYTVVGVMPASFHSLPESVVAQPAAYYRPVAEKYDNEERDARHLRAIARLKPGTTFAQAQAEMTLIASRLEATHPTHNKGYGVHLVSLPEDTVGGLRPTLVALFAAVGSVLLIACANIGNLLLARSAARQKEIAIRLALGASRWRLVRQLLTESVLLALLGGGVGLLLALWGTSFVETLGASVTPLLHGIKVDSRVLGFTLVASLATGILFGLAPALSVSRPDLNSSLKEGGHGTGTGSVRNRLRSALVLAEIALALVLLVGAGLAIKSVLNLRAVNPGFSPERLLTMNVALPGAKYPQPADWIAFHKKLGARVQELPGVQAAGLTSVLPLSDNFDGRGLAVEDYPKPRGEEINVDLYVTDAGYLRAMAIPLRKGRAFDEHDLENSAPVVLINETMARNLWPGADPLGKRVRLAGSDKNPESWRTVVGVVSDVSQYGLDRKTPMQVYFPQAQFPTSQVTLVVRSAAADPKALIAPVRGAIRAIDADQAAYDLAAMTDLFANSIALRRLLMVLLAVFAGLALALAALGLYGVMAFLVSQRTREMGIRLALGARPRDLVRLVAGQSLRLALLGLALGLIVAVGATRGLGALLYGVSPLDPATLVGVSGLLLLVAALAGYLPARRAGRVDPMVALREG